MGMKKDGVLTTTEMRRLAKLSPSTFAVYAARMGRIRTAKAINKIEGVGHQSAACRVCGGWTGSGGMSQHSASDVLVQGRIGCVCHRTTTIN